MTTLTTAILDLARSLREAGADEKLTEAITTGVSRAVEAGGGENATKTSLANVETRTTNLKTQIANVETRLTHRLYGITLLIVLTILIRPFLPPP